MLKKFLSTTLLFSVVTGACLAQHRRPQAAKMLSRLPAAAQQTIRAELDGGRLNSIQTDNEDGEMAYDVEMTQEGQTRDFTVGADGKLIDIQVFPPELPAAVQQTIQRETADATLGEIDKSLDDADVSYDVEMTRDGQTRDFDVGADGALLDIQVFFRELPAAVRQTIRKETAGARLGEIDKSLDDADISYDVEMTQEGQTRDFDVGADGGLLDEEVFLNELPDGLQRAIQRGANGGQISDIYKSTDEGETSYDVDVSSGGRTRDFTFGEDGKLLSQEIFLPELPAAVQQTIQKQTVGATLGEIDESLDDVDVSYDVEMTRDGRARDFDVGVNGDLQDEEAFLNELPDALQQAIQKGANGDQISDIYKSTEDGQTSYDVDMAEAGATRTVTFDANGKILPDDN